MFNPTYQNSFVAVTLLTLASAFYTILLPKCIRAVKLSRIPLVGKRPGEWLDGKARKRLSQNYRQIVADGIKQVGRWAIALTLSFANYGTRGSLIFESKYPEGFQIVGETSRQIVIPPEDSTVFNKSPRLSTTEPLGAFLKLTFPGFEGSNSILGDTTTRSLFITMLRSKLNQNLGRLTGVLVDEASCAFTETWGLQDEWHEISLRLTALDLVSRLSTRIFLGPELCRDTAWRKIIVDYALNTFNCARTLRGYPGVTARVAQWLLKDCQVLREQVSMTRSLLGPFIEDRLRTVELARQGRAEMPNDAIVWLHEVANGQPYDPVTVQLGVSVTAIHTTTDLLTQTLLDLVAHPEIIEPLRKEIEGVVAEHGWGTTTLHKMILLDSVVKETQRLKPASGATTGRYARSEVTLPNGLVIPKGTFAFSSMQRMWDDKYYPNHDKWDGYRFYNMRKEPGKEAQCQLVTTSPEHMGFGHGIHACPGRFLAAAEVKIILSHALMVYDFECATEEIPKPWINGFEFLTNPEAKLLVRKRRL